MPGTGTTPSPFSSEQHATIARYLAARVVPIDLHGLTREHLDTVLGFVEARRLRWELHGARPGQPTPAGVTPEQWADLCARNVAMFTTALDKLLARTDAVGDGARVEMSTPFAARI